MTFNTGLTQELYVTSEEHEAHALENRLRGELIRAQVEIRANCYVVLVAADALDRAKRVRFKYFNENGWIGKRG